MTFVPEASVRETSFRDAGGEPVSALLCTGIADGPKAGLLFVHWGFGDRTSFQSEATAYAASGATSLLIDAPGFGLRKGMRVPARSDARAVRAYAEHFIGDLQRSIDFLCEQPTVDAARLGFVGHSLGATIAGAFLAREPRVKAAVLAGGTGALSRLWLTARDPEGARSLEYLDGVRCLPQANASLFLQFAERDGFISSADADAQIAAAREPKRVKWYACDHAFCDEALQDRAAWLAQQLGWPSAPQGTEEVSLPRSQLWRYRAIKRLLRVASWFGRR